MSESLGDAAKALACNAVSIVFAIGAVILAANDGDDWGWFMLLAVLTVHTFGKRSSKESK
jgi:hypothetical protein